MSTTLAEGIWENYCNTLGNHVTREAVAKIVNEVIPDLDAETDDYVRKLIGADNLPMWED